MTRSMVNNTYGGTTILRKDWKHTELEYPQENDKEWKLSCLSRDIHGYSIYSRIVPIFIFNSQLVQRSDYLLNTLSCLLSLAYFFKLSMFVWTLSSPHSRVHLISLLGASVENGFL